MGTMDHTRTVASVAAMLGLLDANGDLLALDSLMVLDFAIALEEQIGVQVPATSLTPEVFTSVDSVARMLVELTGSAG
jgi:acyl carrier protein